jgi:hypothetical protein
MIALRTACLAPELLLSLSLINTHAGGIKAATPVSGLIPMLMWAVSAVHTVESRVKSTMRIQYGKDRKRKCIESWKRLKAAHTSRISLHPRPSFRDLIAHMVAVGTHYVSNTQLVHLRNTGLPIQIFVGLEDIVVRPSNSFDLQEILQCKIHAFEDVGHGLCSEIHQTFNGALVTHFCESTRPHVLQNRALRLFQLLRSPSSASSTSFYTWCVSAAKRIVWVLLFVYGFGIARVLFRTMYLNQFRSSPTRRGLSALLWPLFFLKGSGYGQKLSQGTRALSSSSNLVSSVDMAMDAAASAF